MTLILIKVKEDVSLYETFDLYDKLFATQINIANHFHFSAF